MGRGVIQAGVFRECALIEDVTITRRASRTNGEKEFSSPQAGSKAGRPPAPAAQPWRCVFAAECGTSRARACAPAALAPSGSGRSLAQTPARAASGPPPAKPPPAGQPGISGARRLAPELRTFGRVGCNRGVLGVLRVPALRSRVSARQANGSYGYELAPESLLAAETAGSRALVPMSENLFANGTSRTVGGYEVYGNAGLVVALNILLFRHISDQR